MFFKYMQNKLKSEVKNGKRFGGNFPGHPGDVC